MNFLNLLKKAKKRVAGELDLMLTEAEQNTPNLHEYQPRQYLEQEVQPAALREGDVVQVVEHRAHDRTLDDITGRAMYHGTVDYVDTKHEKVYMTLSAANVTDAIPFDMGRFFKV